MSVLEPGRPCTFCDVRPDVACRHRPADPTWQGISARKPSPGPPNREFSAYSGIRQIFNARTGQMVRIRGVHD